MVDCRAALSAGIRRVTRGLRPHRAWGPHAHGHAHRAMFGPPAPTPPPACSDTDAPFRALQQPPGSTPATPGTLGKAAGLAAAATAAGTGAGLYRSLAGAPSPGIAPRTFIPGPIQAPELASSAVPSFVAPLGTNDTPPVLPSPGTLPPNSMPGATPTAVAEPASALVLGAALLACVLVRARKRSGPGVAATGRSR